MDLVFVCCNIACYVNLPSATVAEVLNATLVGARWETIRHRKMKSTGNNRSIGFCQLYLPTSFKDRAGQHYEEQLTPFKN